MITFKLLDTYKEIAHFCTDREGGVSVGNYASFNLSPFTGDTIKDFNDNYLILCDELGIKSENLIVPFQSHGIEIREIDNSYFKLSNDKRSNYLNKVDALYTRLTNVCIGVTTADCVPLILFDPKKKVIAVAHAGWKGTCERIAEKTILTLKEKFDCMPADIRVVIGPSISPNVYEVGKEVVDSFEKAGFDMSKIVKKKDQSFFLDLWKANKLSLEKVGVLSNHIEISGICTYTEHERFFSARRLGIKSGRMLSGIMLKGYWLIG